MITDSRQIDFIWESSRGQPPFLRMKDFLGDLLNCLGLDGIELAVLVVDDDRMKALNRDYRQRNGTTDVLSFPTAMPQNGQIPRHLGDIVISCRQAEHQAAALGHSIEAEMRFLCLHGVLHLLGYDHETDNGEMMRLQTELKTKLAAYF